MPACKLSRSGTGRRDDRRVTSPNAAMRRSRPIPCVCTSRTRVLYAGKKLLSLCRCQISYGSRRGDSPLEDHLRRMLSRRGTLGIRCAGEVPSTVRSLSPPLHCARVGGRVSFLPPFSSHICGPSAGEPDQALREPLWGRGGDACCGGCHQTPAASAADGCCLRAAAASDACAAAPQAAAAPNCPAALLRRPRGCSSFGTRDTQRSQWPAR